MARYFIIISRVYQIRRKIASAKGVPKKIRETEFEKRE